MTKCNLQKIDAQFNQVLIKATLSHLNDDAKWRRPKEQLLTEERTVHMHTQRTVL